jgi:TatD DNase family protein
MSEQDWDHLGALMANPRARAVGEIGLDYFRNLSPPEVQRQAFERQLGMADARDLPVIVHDREAHHDVTAALLAWTGRRGHAHRGVLHAFSGDADMAVKLSAAGFLVSFALPVAFRSASGPRAAAATLEDGRFLVETDAPYLGFDRDRRNEPTTALRVVAELARLRGTAPQALVGPMGTAYRGLLG